MFDFESHMLWCYGIVYLAMDSFVVMADTGAIAYEFGCVVGIAERSLHGVKGSHIGGFQ